MTEAVSSDARGRRTPKAGRPFTEPRARSQEYEALVRFLRQRKAESGLTLSQLADTAPLRKAELKKSAIGERLAGDKLTTDFVEAFVLACTEAKELLPRRGRLLKEGAELLRVAQARHTPVMDLSRLPASTRNVALDAQDLALKAQAKLIDLHEQLDRKNHELATLADIQRQSQQALRESDSLSSVLSVWVVVLADEVERLGRERELAMTARPPDLARLSGVDVELARTVARHRRTATELAQVDQDRRLATALLAEALTRTRRVREDVRGLRAVAGLPTREDATTAGRTRPFTNGIASPSAFGDDIDIALDRAEAVGRRIADRLRDALTALDEEAVTQAQSAPASTPLSTNSADNGLTGSDAVDNTGEAMWWDLLAQVPTENFVWAEEAALALVRDRDAHDPRFLRLAGERPARDVLLLADRLQEHAWLEGAARARIALAMSLAPDELVPLIIALTGAGSFLRRDEQGAQLLRAALAGRAIEETLALHNALPYGADIPPVVAAGLAAIAQRPYPEVVALVRKQLMDNPRLLTHGPLMEAIVRNWLPTEVVDLVREVVDIEEGYVVAHVFFALGEPPVNSTELLVRLWAEVPAHPMFGEMLPTLYPGGATWEDLTRIIASLHADRPSPLDRAARELAAEIMPLIIRRTSLDTLTGVGDRLARRGLSPTRIFEPYADLLVPDFALDEG